MTTSHEINFNQLTTPTTRRSQDILALAYTKRQAHDEADFRDLAEYLGIDHLLPRKSVLMG